GSRQFANKFAPTPSGQKRHFRARAESIATPPAPAAKRLEAA
ncbi:hypothetical protein ACVKSW_005258, partial [Pseudomonas sp. PvP003]